MSNELCYTGQRMSNKENVFMESNYSELTVYNGEKPYIFISYAHRDSRRVLPAIKALQEQGYRIWFDQGIEAGTEWSNSIAAHLRDCSTFVIFVSENSMSSENCLDEVAYAKTHQKPSLMIYLEENVKLPQGIDMQTSRFQRLYINRQHSLDGFARKVNESPMFESCREQPIDVEMKNMHEIPQVPITPSTGDNIQKKGINIKIVLCFVIPIIIIIVGVVSFVLINNNSNNNNDGTGGKKETTVMGLWKTEVSDTLMEEFNSSFGIEVETNLFFDINFSETGIMSVCINKDSFENYMMEAALNSYASILEENGMSEEEFYYTKEQFVQEVRSYIEESIDVDSPLCELNYAFEGEKLWIYDTSDFVTNPDNCLEVSYGFGGIEINSNENSFVHEDILDLLPMNLKRVG